MGEYCPNAAYDGAWCPCGALPVWRQRRPRPSTTPQFSRGPTPKQERYVSLAVAVAAQDMPLSLAAVSGSPRNGTRRRYRSGGLGERQDDVAGRLVRGPGVGTEDVYEIYAESVRGKITSGQE